MTGFCVSPDRVSGGGVGPWIRDLSGPPGWVDSGRTEVASGWTGVGAKAVIQFRERSTPHRPKRASARPKSRSSTVSCHPERCGRSQRNVLPLPRLVGCRSPLRKAALGRLLPFRPSQPAVCSGVEPGHPTAGPRTATSGGKLPFVPFSVRRPRFPATEVNSAVPMPPNRRSYSPLGGLAFIADCLISVGVAA
jgi:hypothetical protein